MPDEVDREVVDRIDSRIMWEVNTSLVAEEEGVARDNSC